MKYRSGFFAVAFVTLAFGHPAWHGPAPANDRQPAAPERRAKTRTKEVLFHIGGDDQFDKTLSYRMERGGFGKCRVVVDLDAPEVYCPIEMGRWVTLGRSGSQIEFRFINPFGARDYWLHVIWAAKVKACRFSVNGNGKHVGDSVSDKRERPGWWNEERFRLRIRKGDNSIVLKTHNPMSIVEFKDIALTVHDDMEPLPRPICPILHITTLDEFENVIREPGLVLDGRCIRLFAPKRLEKQARIVFPYLRKGYDVLYRLTGMHTNYKVAIYGLPSHSPHCWSGLSALMSAIPFGDSWLELDRYESWKKHRVPRLIGIFEELSHIFTIGHGIRFGMEAVGAYLSGKVCMEVTPTPELAERRKKGRVDTYTVTMRRYIKNGYSFPKDIGAGVSDRIHVEILRRCEGAYGPSFWKDFFAEIKKERGRLRYRIEPKDTLDGSYVRRIFIGTSEALAREDFDRKYQITLECLDRLPGLEIMKMLRELRISTRTTLYSLLKDPSNWDRRFIPPEER